MSLNIQPGRGPKGLKMQKRQITLADGRYLIFFTFEDDQVGSGTTKPEKAETADSSESQSEDKQNV
jgi:hypothetical protein